MATVKVRLKDASGHVLHPEPDWSVVKNRPSITVDSNREIWGTSGSSIRLGANNIYVKDSKRSYEVLLADYPINWSAISGKPDYLVSKNEMFFGYYSTYTPMGGISRPYQEYPAVRLVKHTPDPSNIDNMIVSQTCYYFNGSSWAKFDVNKFKPSL